MRLSTTASGSMQEQRRSSAHALIRSCKRLADSLAMSFTRGHGAPTVSSPLAILYAVRVRHGDQSAATVIASASLGGYQQVQHAALLGSVALSALLLVGSYPVLRFAGRRALAPVERMTHQAREWSVRAPGERFGSGQRFAELCDLATTLDDVLDRLSAVLQARAPATRRALPRTAHPAVDHRRRSRSSRRPLPG